MLARRVEHPAGPLRGEIVWGPDSNAAIALQIVVGAVGQARPQIVVMRRRSSVSRIGAGRSSQDGVPAWRPRSIAQTATPGTRAQVEFFKMFATWRTAVGSAMTRPSAI